MGSDGGGDDFVDESESLSQDERDLILAQLYYSTSTVPTSKQNPLPEKPSNAPSPKSKKITFDDYLSEPDVPSSTNEQTSKKIPFDEYLDTQPAVPSTKFTFELDLDNLPSPPIPTAVEEAPSLDEDDEEYVFNNRGRYFAPPMSNAPSPFTRVCFRCNQPGHISANCTHLVCRECGALDSHPTHRCPTRQFCQNCSQTGHNRYHCPFTHNEDPSKPCRMCGDYGHVAATCHQIWRYYRPGDPTKLQPVHDIERYCYNCAAMGHLGDDCIRPRPWNVQGGRVGVVVSAFGEGNVPEWAKLRDPPPTQKGGNPPKRKAEQVDEEEEEDDGWFGERLHGGIDRDPPHRKRPPRRAEISLKQEAIANSTESRRTRLPPQSHSQSYRPPPRGTARPRGYSYRGDYRSRDRAKNDGRDWDSRADQWKRQRNQEPSR